MNKPLFLGQAQWAALNKHYVSCVLYPVCGKKIVFCILSVEKVFKNYSS